MNSLSLDGLLGPESMLESPRSIRTASPFRCPSDGSVDTFPRGGSLTPRRASIHHLDSGDGAPRAECFPSSPPLERMRGPYLGADPAESEVVVKDRERKRAANVKLRRSAKLSAGDIKKLARLALESEEDLEAALEADSPPVSPVDQVESVAVDKAADERVAPRPEALSRTGSFKSLEEVRKVRELLDGSSSPRGTGAFRSNSPRRRLHDSNSPRKFHDNSPRRSPRMVNSFDASASEPKVDGSRTLRRWASSPHSSPNSSPRLGGVEEPCRAEPGKQRRGRARRRVNSTSSSEDDDGSSCPSSSLSPRISEKYGPLTDSNEMKWNLKHLDDLEVVSSLRDDASFMQNWEKLQDNYQKTLIGKTTSLHMAAAYNNWGAIELLLQNGSDIDGQDSDGWTPLMYAVSRSAYRTAQLLLNIGADTMVTNSHGDTVLHLLASRPPMDVVEQHEWQHLFATILMCYSKQVQTHGQVKMPNAFRKASVDEGLIQELISLPGDDDNTPLHKAILSAANNADILFVVNVLISWGANKNAVNSHGLTPGALAKRLRNHTVAEILTYANPSNKLSADVFRCATGPPPSGKLARSVSSTPMRRKAEQGLVFRSASDVPDETAPAPRCTRMTPRATPMLLILVPQCRQDWVLAYDAFCLDKNSSERVKLSANLFHRLRQVDCLICPCYSSLGPKCPQYSLSADIIRHIGPEFSEDVDRYIVEHFYGEVPVGSVFMLQTKSKTTKRSVYVLFLVLGDEEYDTFGRAYAYHGFRAALSFIREHNMRSHELSEERTISRILCPLFEPFGAVAAMPDPSRVITHQMALAYRNSPTSVPNASGFEDPAVQPSGPYGQPLPSPVRRQRASACIPEELDEIEQEQRLIQVVMRRQLRARGLASAKEVAWLLNAIADKRSEPVQRAASVELFSLLHGWKRVSPQDVQKEELLAQMTGHRPAMDAIMQLAGSGQLQFSTEIPYDQLDLVEVIGRGASAIVHKAVYKNHEVAVKIFREGIDPVEFRQEVVLLSILESKFLVKMLGVGFADAYQDKPFIVTELMKMSLFHLLHRSKESLSLDDRIRLAVQATKGVQYLHSMGIIHRDIKSLNLLVDNSGTLKVTDFGTSRMCENQKKNMTLNVGTCAWMAPEVMVSTKYSAKADIFSLGMVLYEIFAQKLPYADVEQHMISRLIEKGTKPAIPKSVPKAAVKLIKECWSEKPAKRPACSRILASLEGMRARAQAS